MVRNYNLAYTYKYLINHILNIFLAISLIDNTSIQDYWKWNENNSFKSINYKSLQKMVANNYEIRNKLNKY